MARALTANEGPTQRKLSPQRRYSWAIDMEYPLELGKLSRLSYFGTGIGKELQVPEWDFKSTIDTKTVGRLFLQKSPRDVFNVELKREMVDNDRRLKSSMTRHRKAMHKESQKLEQVIRKHEKPYVCHRGNIKSRYGEKFDKLPSSSLHVHQGSLSSPATNTAVPMTVVDAETVLSEQFVVCRTCKKTYKESRNTETSCRYHYGPIIAVFGGMCQNCGMLDYTEGCVVGFHSRKKPLKTLQPPRDKAADSEAKAAATKENTPLPMQDEGVEINE